jgi:hypothetical protein
MTVHAVRFSLLTLRHGIANLLARHGSQFTISLPSYLSLGLNRATGLRSRYFAKVTLQGAQLRCGYQFRGRDTGRLTVGSRLAISKAGRHGGYGLNASVIEKYVETINKKEVKQCASPPFLTFYSIKVV